MNVRLVCTRPIKLAQQANARISFVQGDRLEIVWHMSALLSVEWTPPSYGRSFEKKSYDQTERLQSFHPLDFL